MHIVTIPDFCEMGRGWRRPTNDYSITSRYLFLLLTPNPWVSWFIVECVLNTSLESIAEILFFHCRFTSLRTRWRCKRKEELGSPECLLSSEDLPSVQLHEYSAIDSTGTHVHTQLSYSVSNSVSNRRISLITTNQQAITPLHYTYRCGYDLVSCSESHTSPRV